VRVADLLVEFKETPKSGDDPPVLTLTERNGFVPQAERFNKRLATEDTSNYKVVRRNDVAFNPYLVWAGAVAQNTITDAGIISPLYPTFKVRDGHDPRFVGRLLLTPSIIIRYDSIAFGSVPRRRRTSVRDFLDLEIPDVPQVNEQRRIAEVLDAADLLLAKRRAAINKLDTLARAVFVDMFGDPVTNPKGFRAANVEESLLFLKYGPRFYDEAYSDTGIPVTRITDLSASGRLDFSSMPRYDVSDQERLKHRLQPGDLIFARSGATVGKIAMMRDDDPECIAGAYFVHMRFNDKIEPSYAFAALRSPTIQAIVAKKSRQAAQQNFSGPGIKRLPLPIPPLDLQRRFAVANAEVEARLRSCERSAASLDSLFASLQQHAFRGDL
jgi:type I restriction enzyme S subunit